MLIIEDLRTKKRYWQPSTTGARGRYNFKPGQIIMKFGEQLRSSVIKEYEWSYIDYDGLKSLLKIDAPKGQEKRWTEEKEIKFIDALDEQLDRVYTRQKSKAGEIERRIETSRREVDDVVARLDSRGPVGRDGPAENEDAPTEEEFMMLEQDLGEIIADVHDLAKFVQVNYTGFQKIIKKHDVSLPYLGRATADNTRKKLDGCSNRLSRRG
jgi:SPX domain protein involved in polyphosphate accumulation